MTHCAQFTSFLAFPAEGLYTPRMKMSTLLAAAPAAFFGNPDNLAHWTSLTPRAPRRPSGAPRRASSVLTPTGLSYEARVCDRQLLAFDLDLSVVALVLHIHVMQHLASSSDRCMRLRFGVGLWCRPKGAFANSNTSR